MFKLDACFKNVSFWQPVHIPHSKYADQGKYVRLFISLGQLADHYLYTGYNFRALRGQLFGRFARWDLKTEIDKNTCATKVKIITYVVTFGILPLIALIFKIQYKRFLNKAWEVSQENCKNSPYAEMEFYPSEFPSSRTSYAEPSNRYTGYYQPNYPRGAQAPTYDSNPYHNPYNHNADQQATSPSS